MNSTIIRTISNDLKKNANKEKATVLQGFFKTGPGEYGEGDIFIGVTVPQIRSLVKIYNSQISRTEALTLLKSKIHEERLLALLILVFKYSKGNSTDQELIFKSYIKSTKYINNWDLVDLTAYHIVGAYLENKDKKPLYELALSTDLWEKRIAIVSTFWYIRKKQFTATLKIAKMLLYDDHDLIHKAVGWMLREVGKRDIEREETFLRKYYKKMPRTMLRYSIEKFPEKLRKDYLKSRV